MQRVTDGHELRSITSGHPQVDGYLEFVGARGAVNTWLATAYDLKVFFEVVGEDPADVNSADVFAFLAQHRTPRREKVVRIEDAYWLHVPLGNLRTGRYIPLHPQRKELLDESVAAGRRTSASRGCSWPTAAASDPRASAKRCSGSPRTPAWAP